MKAHQPNLHPTPSGGDSQSAVSELLTEGALARKGPRKSMLELMKAALVSLTESSSFGVKEPDYYDQRRVVIQRSAVTRTRPAMKTGWKAKFILMVNLPEYVPSQKLNYLLQQAGRIIGLADFRPSFGRFNVTKFQVLDD